MDERPQLFVVRIEQLVIDDLGQHLAVAGKLLERVEFGERQDRRLFEQQVLAGLEDGAGRIEMPVVRGGDANEVDARGQQLRGRLGFGEAAEIGDPAASRRLVSGRSAACLAGDGRQLDFAQAESRVVQSALAGRLKERPVGLVEDHPHADHTGTQPMDG